MQNRFLAKLPTAVWLSHKTFKCGLKTQSQIFNLAYDHDSKEEQSAFQEAFCSWGIFSSTPMWIN